MGKSLHKQQVKEITKDLANVIVRGEAMVPICSVGPLLEYISDLEMEIKELLTCHQSANQAKIQS